MDQFIETVTRAESMEAVVLLSLIPVWIVTAYQTGKKTEWGISFSLSGLKNAVPEVSFVWAASVAIVASLVQGWGANFYVVLVTITMLTILLILWGTRSVSNVNATGEQTVQRR